MVPGLVPNIPDGRLNTGQTDAGMPRILPAVETNEF